MSRFSKIAVRNVLRNRRRSLITLGALTFGIAALMMLRAVQVGFFEMMVDQVVGGDTGAFQVHKRGYLDSVDAFPNQLNIKVDSDVAQHLAQLPNVAAVTPRIMFSGLATNGRDQVMFVGRGVEPVGERKVCPNSAAEVLEGDALSTTDYAAALLGEELADAFHAWPAKARAAHGADTFDHVTLASSSPAGRANSLDVEVKARIRSPGGFESKRILTVPLKLAQDLIGLDGKVTEYVVAVKDIARLEETMVEARRALGPEYEVHPWYEIRPFFRDVINRQKVIIGLIAAVLYVIVLTGIINTMLMSVFERVREIGTMLAVGTRRRQVMKLFLLEAAVLGVLGGLAGVVLGTVVATLVGIKGIPFQMVGSSFPSLLRPRVEPLYAVLVLGVAIVGSVVAAAYPAWRASKLRPVDALRAT